MNRRNFFRALSALAVLPVTKLSAQKFATGGLVEAPKPAPLVGEHYTFTCAPMLDEEAMRRITAAIKKGMQRAELRPIRSRSL
jgi:hypothetical protein